MILAADPGSTGALVAFDEVSMTLLSVIDMPVKTYVRKRDHKEMTVIDDEAVKDWLIGHRDLGCRRMVIEKVGGLPGQSAPFAFRFGYGFGVLISTARMLNYEVEQVTPQVWRTAHFVRGRTGQDKGSARRRAIRLFPGHAAQFKRVKDHGRAEAALIAYWAAERLWPHPTNPEKEVKP